MSGFSLLEVMLAVVVAIGLGSMQLSQIRRNAEYAQSSAVGQQLQEVGRALDSYIVLHNPQLANMTSVAGAGTAEDPGPRTCNTSTGFCTITTQTLILSGVLPQNFSGFNGYGASYKYYIHVGPAPEHHIDGIVVTSTPYMTGSSPRFDLIGQAMAAAGADSGTTRFQSDRIDGYNGTWTDDTYSNNAPDFPKALGLLAYRVGYGTSGWSEFLRRDGSKPMTGDLDMGGHNIDNTHDITADGTITAASFVTATPSASAIVLGASNSTNQTTLGNAGNKLVVRNNGGVQFINSANKGVPITAGDASIKGLTASGDGTFAGGVQAESLSTTSGNIASAANVTAGSAITAQGDIRSSNGSIYSTNGDVSAVNGNLVGKTAIIGGGDVFSSNHWKMANGGGWMMNNTGTMEVIGDKNLSTGGTITGGTLVSNGDVMVNDYLHIKSTGGGSGCTVGNFSRSASGALLMCVNGTWESPSTWTSVTTVSGANKCPAGRVAISCGWDMIAHHDVEDPYAPPSLTISGNRCMASGGGATDYRIYTYCVGPGS